MRRDEEEGRTLALFEDEDQGRTLALFEEGKALTGKT